MLLVGALLLAAGLFDVQWLLRGRRYRWTLFDLLSPRRRRQAAVAIGGAMLLLGALEALGITHLFGGMGGAAPPP